MSEWKQHEEEIKRLYKHNSLKEVKAHMEKTYGFLKRSVFPSIISSNGTQTKQADYDAAKLNTMPSSRSGISRKMCEVMTGSSYTSE